MLEPARAEEFYPPEFLNAAGKFDADAFFRADRENNYKVRLRGRGGGRARENNPPIRRGLQVRLGRALKAARGAASLQMAPFGRPRGDVPFGPRLRRG